MSGRCFLGIDTSNYKTSVALVDEDGEILANHQRFLTVKEGERGLRQSDAVFQHVNRLPEMMEQLFRKPGGFDGREIAAVSVSERPRPVEGSYMPVFMAGLAVARSTAAALGVPLYRVSHQEGHIEAVRHGTPLERSKRFVSFHFSGGTTEAILVEERGAGTSYKIVGGSRDISYGQLLDRVGVALGMHFPCGAELDEIAMKSSGGSVSGVGWHDGNRGCGVTLSKDAAEKSGKNPEAVRLPVIRSEDGWINLSGIETCCQRLIREGKESEALIRALFREVTASVGAMTRQIAKKYDVADFLYAGGVSSSQYVRTHLDTGTRRYFGAPELSADNAVGVALSGGKYYAAEACQCNTTE